MKFLGYIIADSEIIGISPIKQVPSSDYFSTHWMLRFDLITKQQVIAMDSDPVHYTDAIGEDHPVIAKFRQAYTVLRLEVAARFEPRMDFSDEMRAIPTLDRNF